MAVIRYLFLINPAAGKNDASITLVPLIRAAANRAGITPSIIVTRHAGHAREVAAACAASGEKSYLYACGGDGTLNEVLQGAAEHTQLSIGCIPCGSGNDYVRNFGSVTDFWDLDAQLAAIPRTVDMIKTPQGYGIDIYAAGVDAQVANGISKWRRVPHCGGTTAYTLSILEAVCSSFRHRLRITADDRELEGTYMMLAVCNARMYGGGYCAAPLAQMDDGFLDVVLLKPVPRLLLPGLLGGYKKGAHLTAEGKVTKPYRPYLTYFRTRTIDIQVLDEMPMMTTLDGECFPQKRMYAEAARHSIRILLPPKLAQNTPVLQAMGE